MAQRHSDHDVVFVSSALDPGDLFLRSMRGREALSRLFEFDLVFETTGDTPLTDDQIAEMLSGTASISFGSVGHHPIFGVLSSLDMLPAAEEGAIAYRATLVPRLWYTTLSVRSRVFQDLSVPEIVKQVLLADGFEDGQTFDLQVSAKHPKREYTVQYQESDFDFISRLLEYEGIFYVIEQTDTGDKVVFADANEAFLPISGRESISFDARGGSTRLRETVVALGRHYAVIPQKLMLRDYNYRTPSLTLAADTTIDDHGHGLQLLYGEHFKDVADGKRLAKIRSEEFLLRKQGYVGSSHVRGLRAGHKFTLEDHPHMALNQPYYVTTISHSVEQHGQTDGGGGTQGGGYRNEFELQTTDTPFHPARITPKPRIAGLMHAKIDGSGSGTAAPIDSMGRYRVLMPYDLAGAKGGKATRWIRMAQPSSGGGYGMHFPLHSGVEVMLAHVDGDPDRPVIVGSVPNPDTWTPVHSGNATQSVMRTRSGIHIEFEDDA